MRRLSPEEALRLREGHVTQAADVVSAVSEIIADVRARGDAAVGDAVRKYQDADLSPQQFRVADGEWDRLAADCPAPVRRALELAAARISAFQSRLVPQGYEIEAGGAKLELLVHPLDRVLCYAPGGRASYPSTVLMTAVPARLAGVEVIAVTSPRITPEVAAAARLAGAHALYRLGGAHAVAAFALATQTIGRVDKIVGPGNAYVTEAKRQLDAEVGIDMLAGPTELVVVCDWAAEPGLVAADLVAQAEHDPRALALAVTPVPELADKILASLEGELRTFPNPVAEEALRARGGVVVTQDLAGALALADRLAPEHVELMVDDPLQGDALRAVTHAGAVFLGPWTPVPVGDYVAGPNHTLPTGGTARFASGLSPADFVRRQSVVTYAEERLRLDAEAIRALAAAEGLAGHARAVEVREA